MKKTTIKLLAINICLGVSMLTLCKGGGRRDIIEGQNINRSETQQTDMIKKNIVQNKLSKKSNQKTTSHKK